MGSEIYIKLDWAHAPWFKHIHRGGFLTWFAKLMNILERHFVIQLQMEFWQEGRHSKASMDGIGKGANDSVIYVAINGVNCIIVCGIISPRLFSWLPSHSHHPHCLRALWTEALQHQFCAHSHIPRCGLIRLFQHGWLLVRPASLIARGSNMLWSWVLWQHLPSPGLFPHYCPSFWCSTYLHQQAPLPKVKSCQYYKSASLVKPTLIYMTPFC